MKSLLKAIIFASVVLSSVSAAQTRVVVIPLMGDDAESTWRGSWVTDFQYSEGDLVEFDGSSYIAIINHTSAPSNIPPSSEWDLVAASGTDLYERVIVVNGGGTPTENRNALSSAFSQANSLASAASPVLVYVEPGVYADGTITSIENVYVMGAGRGTNIQGAFTIVNGGISNVFFNTPDGESESLRVGGVVSIENITIEGNYTISAIFGAMLTIDKLTFDDDDNIVAIDAPLATSLLIESSNISVTTPTGDGIAIASAATTTIRNSTLRGGNGVLTASSGDSVFISDSEIRGIDGTIVVSGSGANFDIRHSLLENPSGRSLVRTLPNGSTTVTNSRFIVNNLDAFSIASSTEVCLGNSFIVTGSSPSAGFLADTCQ